MINREKVAKLLREAGKNAGDWCDSADEAFEKVDTIIGTYDSCKYSDFFNRLADLIDPTCEVVGVPNNDEFMIRVVSGFECKKCGHEAIVERSCNGWAEPPKYCPNCGARVVRE
jgi:hypothetical protein